MIQTRQFELVLGQKLLELCGHAPIEQGVDVDFIVGQLCLQVGPDDATV
jgi:hypothetical protein